MIVVVDYGMGNLRNVRRAFEYLSQEVHLTSDPVELSSASRIVLPGVGAFGEAVHRIDDLGLRESLLHHVSAGKPMLGICLGMQLLFPKSEEDPDAAGLGVLEGSVKKFGPGVKKFGPGVKIPHIGWNDVQPVEPSSFFYVQEDRSVFYFVHSYYVGDTPWRIGRT
ncbi:MAG: imidazole glycerol phosphate synthase subunit HisH, partial [Bacteroidota bacterium]